MPIFFCLTKTCLRMAQVVENDLNDSCPIQQRSFCWRGSHLHCVEFQCHFEVGFILSASLIMIAQALGSPRFPKHGVMDPQAMEGCRSLHRSGILSGIACGPCFFPALCFQTLNFFCHVMDSNNRIKSIRFKNKFASKKHLCQESRHKILGR